MKISFHARLLTYAAVLAYVALDLFAFRGPLRHSIDSRKIDSPESVERAKQSGLVALVLGRPIHRPQLERVAQERAWMEGKSWSDVPTDQRKFIRKACLGDLIDHQLIRSKSRQIKTLYAPLKKKSTNAMLSCSPVFPPRTI
jgi:hypothetical protein